MKVLVVSKYNKESAKDWSGTPHFIYRQIENLYDEVSMFTPQKRIIFRLFAKIARRFFKIFGNSSIDLTRTHYYSKAIGKEVGTEINRSKPDLVVGIAASIELAYVETDIPIIHLTDATYSKLVNYYQEFTGLWRWLENAGNQIESRIIQNAKAVICSSDWASSSIILDYGKPDGSVFTILLGANVKDMPCAFTPDFKTKFNGTCKLLFVGKDWERKGGDLVLETYNELVRSGFDIDLTIVGCIPTHPTNDPNIHVISHLNKDKIADLKKINDLYNNSSFLIVPTKAEAYGLVFAEAAAFGTPVLAPKTGGVPSIVIDGKTGILLESDASASEYSAQIMDLWSKKKNLYAMSVATRSRFENALNWDQWSKQFDAVVRQIV